MKNDINYNILLIEYPTGNHLMQLIRDEFNKIIYSTIIRMR